MEQSEKCIALAVSLMRELRSQTRGPGEAMTVITLMAADMAATRNKGVTVDTVLEVLGAGIRDILELEGNGD